MEYHVLTPATAGLLRQARLRRGLSLKETARIAGTSKGYLSMLESAQRAPSLTMAEVLIRAYQLDGAEARALKGESIEGTGRDKARRKGKAAA
jgi:transcriptional regulator with XRE-family HTH domain